MPSSSATSRPSEACFSTRHSARSTAADVSPRRSSNPEDQQRLREHGSDDDADDGEDAGADGHLSRHELLDALTERERVEGLADAARRAEREGAGHLGLLHTRRQEITGMSAVAGSALSRLQVS